MQCSLHVDLPASGFCTRCDQPTCDNCSQEHQGKTFCPTCAAFLAQRAVARPALVDALSPPSLAVPPPQIEGSPTAPLAAPPTADAGSPPEVFAGEVFAGDVYQGPEPATAPGATPAPGNVFEETTAEVYGEPPPAPAPAPLSPRAQGSAGGVAAPAASGSIGRAVLFGVGLGLLAAYVWYGVSIATDWKLGPVAAIVGAVVGWATSMGAGRQDFEVGLLAIALALFSMVTGEYLIWDHVVSSIAEEELAYEELIREIGADRRYTATELERLYTFAEEEDDLTPFSSLSDDDRRGLRAWADEEYLRLTSEPLEVTRPSLGQFFSYLAFDIWNVVFLFIGCGAAYRMANGTGDD